jgi:prevent-host-death family protein
VTHLISSRDFARDLKKAKEATAHGPVLITTRGKPEFALLSYRDFEQLAHAQPERSLWQAMAELPDTGGIEFEPSRLELTLRVPDLSDDIESETGA